MNDREIVQIISLWSNIIKYRNRYSKETEKIVWDNCPEKLKIKELEYLEDWKIPKEFCY